MIIFDKWGKELFETNDYRSGWDGTVEGKPAATGVYSYFITYTISDVLNPASIAPVKLRGILTLLR